MPTWWIGEPKKTRSPGRRSSRATGTPTPNRARLAWGSDTPSCAKEYLTRPEQSKPLGDSPPHTYRTPTYCIATPTTGLPRAEAGTLREGAAVLVLTAVRVLAETLCCRACCAASR